MLPEQSSNMLAVVYMYKCSGPGSAPLVTNAVHDMEHMNHKRSLAQAAAPSRLHRLGTIFLRGGRIVCN